MAADMSGEQMQAKITSARREAEGLKDRIKRRKDELADSTRKDLFFNASQPIFIVLVALQM
jgi:guanine nucleotide-binding protein G(I)/G(S)/G(T) subunit beta-1